MPDGATSADVQDAVNAALAAGGGLVDVGTASYTCTSTITIDPTRVSLVGDGATFDSTTGADGLVVLLIQTPSGGTQYGHGTQRVQGIRFRGKSNKSQVAIQCYTATNAVDHSTRIAIRDCDIKTYLYGIEYKQNAFAIKHDHIDIYDCSVCLKMQNETNRGECMVWNNCSFFNSGSCYKLHGSNYDCRFFGCSFDYSTQFGYSDNLVEFHGCHFEKTPPNTNEWCFEMDNGSRLSFYGGDIGFSAGSTTETIFKMWGTFGGGSVRFYGTKRDYPSGATLYTYPANVTAYD